MILEKAYLFPNDDSKITHYIEYLHQNFRYSFDAGAWILNEFYIWIDLMNEWCVWVEPF